MTKEEKLRELDADMDFIEMLLSKASPETEEEDGTYLWYRCVTRWHKLVKEALQN